MPSKFFSVSLNSIITVIFIYRAWVAYALNYCLYVHPVSGGGSPSLDHTCYDAQERNWTIAYNLVLCFLLILSNLYILFKKGANDNYPFYISKGVGFTIFILVIAYFVFISYEAIK